MMVIERKIYELRGEKVMLDFDLAELYGVVTKVLNQAVRRNIERFPEEDFMFQLSKEEWNVLRSQIVTLEQGKGRYPKYLPYAFTEYGATMLASILRSEKAVKMNIVIIRAFIALRRSAMNYKEMADKLLQLEKQYNKQFTDVYQALDFLIKKKTKEEAFNQRRRIGFKP